MIRTILSAGLAVAPVVVTAGPHSHIEIDSNSSRRGICDVKFAKIDGLKVIASLVPETRWKTRVDVERYTACPYEVRMNYEGQTLRIDFSRAVTKNMVDEYEPGLRVNTGFFHLEGDGWIVNDELTSNPANRISVKTSKQETLVAGIAYPISDKGHPSYACFSFALIMQNGMATGAICSKNEEAPLTFARLFAKEGVMSSN